MTINLHSDDLFGGNGLRLSIVKYGAKYHDAQIFWNQKKEKEADSL